MKLLSFLGDSIILINSTLTTSPVNTYEAELTNHSNSELFWIYKLRKTLEEPTLRKRRRRSNTGVSPETTCRSFRG